MTSIRIISKLRRHINAHIQAVIQAQGGLRVVNMFTKSGDRRRMTCPWQVAHAACMTAPSAKA